MNRFIKITLLVLFLQLQSLFSQGLLFHANYEPINKRTSLYLFSDKTESFDGFLDISFEFSLYDTETFGYLLFVNDEKHATSYSITISPEDKFVNLKLNITGKNCILKIPLSKEKLGIRSWQNIRMVFNNKKDEILVQLNNKNYIVKTSTHSLYVPILVFGKYKSYIDLPKFAIRNIELKSKNKSKSFKLDQKEGSTVTDTEGVKYGYTENPIWMVNDSYKWALRCNKTFQNPGIVNYDETKHLFYLLNKDSLFVYDPRSNIISSKPYANNCPAEIRLGTSYIDKQQQKLIAYEVNNLPINTVSVSALDLNDFTWKGISTHQLPWQLHHHAPFYNEKNGLFTIFGGFGNQHYYNKFNTLSTESGKWIIDKFKGDLIQPRFFTGIAKLDTSKAILYGGIGNESGDITVGKKYYYDCYLIDYDTKTTKLLWKTNLSEKGLVTVRNMIMSDDKKSFYTICYPEYETFTKLKLYRFSIFDGKYEILGDSIPYMSDKIECNANLYYNKLTQEIYCVTQEYNVDGSNVVRIYSISSPPLSEITLVQRIQKTKTIIILFIMLFIAILFIVAILLVKRRKKKKIFKNMHLPDLKYQGDKIRANSIYAFGDFTVFDNKGINISHLFNPKIKQLFLYIFMKGIQNNKGADSREIQEEIWPEKSSDNAKNLKGVAINQLRKIFADIDGIELVHANGYYNIVYDEPLYFDFIQFIDLAKNIPLSMESYRAVYEITSRGVFLQGITTKELKIISASICTSFNETTMSQLSVMFRTRKNEDSVIIASILMNIDIYNLQALNFLLQAYIRIEMKMEARSIYTLYYFLWTDEFRKNYPPELTEYLSASALSKHK
jgi:hypothetical protein